MAKERAFGPALRAKVSRVRVGRLGRNTLYSMVGLVVRAVIQACYLILLSRRMGSLDYGLFAGSVAVAVLFAPLSGWGVSYVLAQQVARNPMCRRALWATALVQVGLSGMLLVIVVMTTSLWMLSERVGAGALLMLALGELVALPVAQAATTLCVVEGRGLAAASAICIVPAARLSAVAAFFIVGIMPSPDRVAALHFGGSLVGAFAAFVLVARIQGMPAWRERLPAGRTAAEGSRYAVGALVGTSYPEIDKVLLLQLAGAAAVGTYTAAFRVMAVLVLPISALVSNTLPRLFAASEATARSRTLKAATIAAFGYAIVAAFAANLVAPYMTDIFGATFFDSGRYLQLLSPWVVLFAMHQCAGTGLTAAGQQWSRIAVEAGGVALIVTVNVIAIPDLGPRGSVLALVCAEAAMACACWVLLRRGNVESV